MYYTRKPINFQRQFSKLLRGIIDRSNIRLKKKREREIERARGGQVEKKERSREREKEQKRERGRKKERRSDSFGIQFSEPSRDDLIGRLKGAISRFEERCVSGIRR